MGFSIVKHSVLLVFNNLGEALRISLLPFLIMQAAQVYLIMSLGDIDVMMASADFEFPVVPYLLVLAAGLILGPWIAVGWHRYALLNERPNGWVPVWQGGRIWGYLGRSILIGLFIVLATIALMIPMMLFMGSAVTAVIAIIIVVLILTVVFYRISPILPAGAVDKKITIKEAWAATKGSTGAIVLTFILLVIMSVLMLLPTILNMGNPTSVINIVYGAVVEWVAMMIGVSVLTTVYGVYVEDRPID